MKRIILVLWLISSSLFADDYSYTPQPKAKKIFEINIGTHYGKEFDYSHKMSLGLRYSFIGIEYGSPLPINNPVPAFYNIPIPHGDYIVETYNKSPYYVAMLLYYDISNDVAIKGRIGGMFQEEVNLSRSSFTGWRFINSSRNNISVVGGLGMSFYAFEKFVISLDFDYSLGVGFTFGYNLNS